MKTFASEKLKTDKPYKQAALYFDRRLKELKNVAGWHAFVSQELETLIALCHYLYGKRDYRAFLAIWENFSIYLFEAGLWGELEKLADEVYDATRKIGDEKAQAYCCLEALSWIDFWKGDLEKAKQWSQEGMNLAQKLHDSYLFALAQSNLGYIAYHKHNYAEAETLLDSALAIFKKHGDKSQTAKTLLYLTYIPFRKEKTSKKLSTD